MTAQASHLIGAGIYSVAEAARLTHVPVASVRRWVSGYRYSHDGIVHSSPSVWHRDLTDLGDHVALTFLDMMEVRFIQCFRRYRLSWPAIREAARIACEMFGDGHPFTRGQFMTDGKRIFRQIEEAGTIRLFDMNRKQWTFNEIVEPSLFHDVELSDDQVVKWFPDYPKKQIMIDPRICFGRPVVAACGIPTETLASAMHVEKSDRFVAKLFGIKPAMVRAALEFEERLAA